jgi:hypothetical protein
MTENEVAEKIVTDENCCRVDCRECPARIDTFNCRCGEFGGGKTESQLQWFKDFLKGAKGMNGIDKAEAKKRLDAIEEEARTLREIIEKGDGLIYDGHNVYIARISGSVCILVGNKRDDYYRWHTFSTTDFDYGTEHAWTNNHKTGQAALDYAKDYDIHVFSDGKEGIQFFYDEYMKG